MKPSAGRADALGFAALALLGILAVGGAARGPGATVLLGAPGWLPAAGVAAGAVVLASVCGPRAGAGLIGLGAPVALLAVAGAGVPGAAALSGAPLGALALAGVVLALWRAAPRPPQWLLLPALFAIYSGVAFRSQLQVGAEGDEPHYMMVAESLLRDHDLALDQDYQDAARWAPFYRKGGLEPHYRVRGREGAIYSLHAVGLSLLVLPAWAAGGYPAVSFFMALLAAGLVREIRELLRAAGLPAGQAEGAAWLIGLSPPVIHYAGLVFTEIPAALAVAFALRRGLDPAGATARVAAPAGLALALLPWLNVRYAALAAVLAIFALLGRPAARAAAAFVAPALVSALALAGYHYALYGFFDPRRVYGARPEFSSATLAEGLPGLLLDQEFGLLVYAPVFVLALAGLALVARARPRLGASAAGLLVVTLALAGSWHMWRGGFNPPARFLVPVVPALALGVAWGLRRGPSAAAALLCGWSLLAGLAGGAEPRLVHRDRDENAPFFRQLSGAEEWTRILPGYVLTEPRRHELAGVWLAALLAAAAPWPVARWPFTARTAGAALGLLAAAGVAGRVSEARSFGRDGVRLLGAPALEVPGFRLVPAAPGTWGASALDWGPAYEPHRFPAGAALGRRLVLAPGSYTIEVWADVLGEGAPDLGLSSERGLRWRGRIERTPSGFAGAFVVSSGQSPVTLWVDGGPPFVLERVLLHCSTIPAGPGLIRAKGGVEES